jgi:hypothetical protein
MDASLKQIKFALQDIVKILDWKVESVNVSNVGHLQFSGLTQLRQIINSVEALGLFADTVQQLKSSAIFTSSSDQMRVQLQEAQTINTLLGQLKSLVSNFLNVLLRTVPDEDPSSLNIKLPPVENFDDLSKVSRDLHLAISQVVFNNEINGSEKIISVENGSIWFNVFIGSTAISVIASIVWSAAVIYKKIQEGRLLEQQIRSLKVNNESMEDVLKAQKAQTDVMIQAEAEHVQSEHFKENASENIERIKNSITLFAQLIGKGAEIHPALVAPENVSNLFPDPKKLIGLESKIKLLSDAENRA